MLVRQALRTETQAELAAKMEQAREETGNDGFIISGLFLHICFALCYHDLAF